MAGTLSAGNILLDAGSNDAPSIAATSSPTAGLVFPAANTIAISTASTERLRIDSGGNIFANSAAVYFPTHASTANIDFKVGASLNTSFRIESTGRLYNSVESDTGTDYRSTLYPGTLCRAWVNFNGAGTNPITPTAAFNCTSVAKTATGDWTVNFVSAMPDANYAVSLSSSPNYGVNIGNFNQAATGAGAEVVPTTSAYRFMIYGQNSNPFDAKYISVIVFR